MDVTIGTFGIRFVNKDRYWLLLICYGFMGFGLSFTFFGSIYLNEIGDPNYRNFANVMFLLPSWCLGEIIAIYFFIDTKLE